MGAQARLPGVGMGVKIDCKGYQGTFQGDGNVIKLGCMDGWTTA